MTNTTKIVIASVSSAVSTAVVGTLCYFKGRSDGFKLASMPATATLPADNATAQRSTHA